MHRAHTKRRRKPRPATASKIIRTTIVLPKTVHSTGHQLAKADRRSFSNFVSTLIEAQHRALIDAAAA